MAVRTVDSLDEAIEHVNRYGTGHSEAIVTSDFEAAARFTNEVDAAAVYVNASTRFTDGGEYGMGAEIGISTSRLHARGPIGLEELTTTKYVAWGDGQIREANGQVESAASQTLRTGSLAPRRLPRSHSYCKRLEHVQLRRAARPGRIAARMPNRVATIRKPTSWLYGTTNTSPWSDRPWATIQPNTQADDDPQDAADDRRDRRLVADHPPQLAAGHAHRPQHADLPRPLEHRQRERVDDPDQADDQAHRQQDVEELEEAVHEVLGVLLVLGVRLHLGRGERLQRLPDRLLRLRARGPVVERHEHDPRVLAARRERVERLERDDEARSSGSGPCTRRRRSGAACCRRCW